MIGQYQIWYLFSLRIYCYQILSGQYVLIFVLYFSFFCSIPFATDGQGDVIWIQNSSFKITNVKYCLGICNPLEKIELLRWESNQKRLYIRKRKRDGRKGNIGWEVLVICWRRWQKTALPIIGECPTNGFRIWGFGNLLEMLLISKYAGSIS